jgi:hypothetical protein
MTVVHWVLPLSSAPFGIGPVLGFVGALFGDGKCWFACPGVPLFYMAPLIRTRD